MFIKEIMQSNDKKVIITVFVSIVLVVTTITYLFLFRKESKQEKYIRPSVYGDFDVELFYNVNSSVTDTYDEDQQKEFFRQMNSCIEDIAQDDWIVVDKQEIGNFYEYSWCTGNGIVDDCRFADATKDRRDQYIFNTFTLFYPQSPEETFGLGLHIRKVPETEGWAITLSYVENGKSIIGDYFHINYAYYEEGVQRPTKISYIGDSFSYQVFETEVHIYSEHTLRKTFSTYLSSDQEFKNYALSMLQALHKGVVEYINSHEAERCEYEQSSDPSLPPICNNRKLTEQEKQEAVLKAEEDFTKKEEIIEKNYEEFYQLLMNVYPFESCWITEI